MDDPPHPLAAPALVTSPLRPVTLPIEERAV
jgi:hypothetical protein